LKHKYICPKCNHLLVEDIYEIIEEMDDGNIYLDAFDALVCSNDCGYYRKINHLFNLDCEANE
jgi:hypothetical protein